MLATSFRVGTRCKGCLLYTSTDPSRNGPFGCNFKVLRSPTSRRDHARHAEPEAGMLTILPADVLQAVQELLAEENV